MNKIYVKTDDGSEVRDSTWVSKEYRAAASVLAKTVSQMDYLRNKLNYLMQLTEDNGDPFLELSDAVNKMGLALASCIVYADAYEQEAADSFVAPAPESELKVPDNGEPEEIEDEQEPDIVPETVPETLVRGRRRTKDVNGLDKN